MNQLYNNIRNEEVFLLTLVKIPNKSKVTHIKKNIYIFLYIYKSIYILYIIII